LDDNAALKPCYHRVVLPWDLVALLQWRRIPERRSALVLLGFHRNLRDAKGNSKVDNCDQLLEQIQMFREYGLGSYRELLIQISKNPAMIFWLDNNENHRDAVNENWGRELLELFSMGVGMDDHANYTEDDVKACAQAFTGWTIANASPRYPYGSYANKFL
jgi:hypothetical protein